MRTEELPATAVRPAVSVVVYEPGDRAVPSGVLLWMHGGGLVMGSPESGHALCSRVAAELGILVVSVDYRLAIGGVHFPVPLDDVVAAQRRDPALALTAPLAAELLAAWLDGEPLPLPRSVAEACHPNRFSVRMLVRGS